MSKKRKYSPLERRARNNTKRIKKLERKIGALESIDWPLIRRLAPANESSGTYPPTPAKNRSGGHTAALVRNRHDRGYW